MNPQRALLPPVLILFVFGGLLGSVAALLASPIGNSSSDLLAMARDLIGADEPGKALAVARHVKNNPGTLPDPREADAVICSALVGLGLCTDALSLLDKVEQAGTMSPLLQADCDLVRLQCAARRSQRDQAVIYLERITQAQAGTPIAAQARTLFDSAFPATGAAH